METLSFRLSESDGFLKLLRQVFLFISKLSFKSNSKVIVKDNGISISRNIWYYNHLFNVPPCGDQFHMSEARLQFPTIQKHTNVGVAVGCFVER